MKNNIKAEIVAHSKRAGSGEEIITYKLTFPRIILSELNTYKMIEKNTSSCLSGSCDILCYRDNSFKTMTIKELHSLYVGGLSENFKIVSFNEDSGFVTQNIGKVFHSGVKPVYRIVFEGGVYLDCTEDHRLFMRGESENKYVTLKDFNIKREGDDISINSKLINARFFSIDLTEIYSKYKNLQVDEELSDNNIFTYSGFGSIPHVEFDLYETLSIKEIEYLGEMETYDIEVDGEYHNFIANGIVVHNSRAIPFEKMVEVVENKPFIPLVWMREHKGMQGTEYLTDPKHIEEKTNTWLAARDMAIDISRELVHDIVRVTYDDSEGYNAISNIEIPNTSLSKNYGNRLLEPWMWVTQLCTGSRESFEHLFNQRCPIYEVSYYITDPVEEDKKIQRTLGGCSKKDIINHIKENNLDTDVLSWDDIEWLKHNRGQAEIHFMDLAEKMYDALNESEPVIMKEDEWHIPFSDRPEFTPEMSLKDKIMLSCAMTARVSFTTIADNEILTLEKAKSIYTKCVQSGHNSVVSHCAKCMTDKEYRNWIKGEIEREDYIVMVPQETHGYCKNIRGFIPLRQYVEDGVELSKFK